MKRDLDEMRDLMLRLEASPGQWTVVAEIIDGPLGREDKWYLGRETPLKNRAEDIFPSSGEPRWLSDSELNSLDLLMDAAFIEVVDDYTFAAPPDEIGEKRARITLAGYDYLDSVRDPEVWLKTKKAAESAGAFSLELLVDVAKSIAAGVLSGLLRSKLGIDP